MTGRAVVRVVSVFGIVLSFFACLLGSTFVFVVLALNFAMTVLMGIFGGDLDERLRRRP